MSCFGSTRIRVITTPKKKVWNAGGVALSPLLANRYLHEMDKYRESNYLHISTLARHKRRKAGKGPSLPTRYADDFVILCTGTKAEARHRQEEMGGRLSNRR